MLINNTGKEYVSNMGKGEIWNIDTRTGEDDVWASSNQVGYDMFFGEADSTNFIGLPFIVVEVMVDGNSKWIYFSAGERNYFGRIRILANGDAREFQVLDTVDDRSGIDGAFLDVRNNNLYGATSFLNFQNLGMKWHHTSCCYGHPRRRHQVPIGRRQ